MTASAAHRAGEPAGGVGEHPTPPAGMRRGRRSVAAEVISGSLFFTAGPDRVRMLLRTGWQVLFAIVLVSAARPAERWVTVALAAVGLAAVLPASLLPELTPDRYWWIRAAGTLVYAATGFGVIVLGHSGMGFVPPMFGVFWSLVRLPPRAAWPLAGTISLALGLFTWWAVNGSTAIGLVGGCTGIMMLGQTIRQARVRAAAAERLLASERREREATARAEVLAERTRLAREIHDILAHTLSAQVVQLEGARLLLTRDAPAADVLSRVEQAQRLARDGLDETRRALESLRGRARPPEEALRALAEAADATFAVHGTVRPLPPETALALQRTAQEALTNARKHAAGASVAVLLRYTGDACEVEVTDTGGRELAGHPDLSGTGGGYGLAGMRERAELLGGTLSAGPDGKGFRVWLRIPA